MVALRLTAVLAGDFESMAALRIAAMRDSLERLGRFDPQRARERLAAQFDPGSMRHIESDGQRIGFVTLKAQDDGALRLEHLYVLPEYQGRGVGTWVMAWVKEQGRDVTLSALKLSEANRFYVGHGFELVGESEFDLDYRWKAGS